MFLVYYGYYEAWEVFVPTTLSAVMMLTLVMLKFYYEELSPRPPAAAAAVGEDTGGDSEPRGKKGRIARVKDASRTSGEVQPLMSSW